MALYLAKLAAAQADPPGNVNVNFDFTTINWWLFAILLFATFIIIRIVGKEKQKWAGTAAITMFLFALVYALFMKYVLPLLNL